MIRDVFKEAKTEPKREIGAPIPLFERLIDHCLEEKTELPIKLFYNNFELIQSIEREVSKILNTRSTLKHNEFEDLVSLKENIGLVQLYGLSDFSEFDGANNGNRPRIASICELAIQTFEPRLSNVKVNIIRFDSQRQALIASISAQINLPKFQQEITFPITINN